MFAFLDFDNETSYNHCDVCGELVKEVDSKSNQFDNDDAGDYCVECDPIS